KNIKEIDGVATKIAIERTLSEIEKIINYVLKAKICTGQMTEGFENVVQLRGIHLVRNQKNPNNIHEPFAILENKSQPDEAYRRIDCLLNRNSMSTLPTKVAHALEQLRVWAQLEEVEDSFAKMFLVSELLWLIWAFGTSTLYKKKQKLVPIIISNLKNRSPFTDEALNKELFS
ncbi:hypothetical protein RclHR1_26880002, partial [Rhizophagus clarus]